LRLIFPQIRINIGMKKTTLFWVLALLITIVSAVYQRISGPTYPRSGSVIFNGEKINYRLERSHTTSSDYALEIKTADTSVHGIVKWRKNYKALDPFMVIPMKGKGSLSAGIPAQAPMEKFQYYIELQKGDLSVMIPEDRPVIVRFKGDVPVWVLIPHIFFMFAAMMFSIRTALETLISDEKLKKLAGWTLIFLFIGGFPLGFMMNHYAFGQAWGGIPFGNDITDNKTLIAFIGWILAYYMIKKNSQPKLFAILAAVLMIIVYSIPHSV
jgi:hypothetical protein